MLSRIDLRDRELTPRELLDVVPRADVDVADAVGIVTPILADVRERGEQALRELGERFDGVSPEHLRVPAERIQAAVETQDAAVLDALREAITRVRAFHEATVPPPVSVQVAPGATVSQRWIPVSRVGLYVPGGLAVYPSSVVMNVVAAQAAGVESIAVATPPQRAFGGEPHPTILAACALLGVDEVYAAGGAQAIGMLAYGVDGLCDPVDIITGPGNVYVAAAKRVVNGVVGIDSEAGPTEIAIIAADSADADFVAARYSEVVVASGDHEFVETLVQLNARGVRTAVASRDEALSATLAIVADRVVPIAGARHLLGLALAA